MVKRVKSLLFDNGYKSFAVNGDPARIIRSNPVGPEVINRVLDVQRYLRDYNPPEGIEPNPDGTPESNMERGSTYVAGFSEEIHRAFNGIFLSDVYDTIFVGQSPLCIVGQKYLYEGVLEGLLVLMEPTVEEYAGKNQGESGKYLEDIGKWLTNCQPALTWTG